MSMPYIGRWNLFREPVVLIMGGRDKGGDYRILEQMMQNSVKQLILLGEASQIIAAVTGEPCADRAGIFNAGCCH